MPASIETTGHPPTPLPTRRGEGGPARLGGSASRSRAASWPRARRSLSPTGWPMRFLPDASYSGIWSATGPNGDLPGYVV